MMNHWRLLWKHGLRVKTENSIFRLRGYGFRVGSFEFTDTSDYGVSQSRAPKARAVCLERGSGIPNKCVLLFVVLACESREREQYPFSHCGVLWNRGIYVAGRSWLCLLHFSSVLTMLLWWLEGRLAHKNFCNLSRTKVSFRNKWREPRREHIVYCVCCWLWFVVDCHRGSPHSFQIFSTLLKRPGTSIRTQ